MVAVKNKRRVCVVFVLLPYALLLFLIVSAMIPDGATPEDALRGYTARHAENRGPGEIVREELHAPYEVLFYYDDQGLLSCAFFQRQLWGYNVAAIAPGIRPAVPHELKEDEQSITLSECYLPEIRLRVTLGRVNSGAAETVTHGEQDMRIFSYRNCRILYDIGTGTEAEPYRVYDAQGRLLDELTV